MYVLKVDGIRRHVHESQSFLQEEAKKYSGCKIEIAPIDSGDLPELETTGMKLPEFGDIFPTDEEINDDFSNWSELDAL